MSTTTVSNKKCDQNTRAAKHAPVRAATDKHKTAHDLKIFERYQRRVTIPWRLDEQLGMSVDLEFEPPKVTLLSRPADFN
jgi:hypothetical protein